MKKIRNFFFETNKDKIFCTMVGDCTISSKYCIIYFAPLFEERMWVQRIVLNFACELWSRYQIPTVFFDYYGYGESDGEHEDFSLRNSHGDVERLLGFLREKYGIIQFIFFGIRTGCAIALSCLSQHQADYISGLILWAPIIDLAGYIHQSLMGTIASQYLIFKRPLAKRDEIIEETLRDGACLREGFIINNIEGYRFGKEFCLELKQLIPKELVTHILCNTLVLEIISPKKKIKRKNSKLGDRELDYPSVGKIESLIVNDNEFWLNQRDYSQRAEETYRITTKWIEDLLAEKLANLY